MTFSGNSYQGIQNRGGTLASSATWKKWYATAPYAVTGDDRLPLKMLALFDASRMVNGLTQSRFPSHFRQTIPPFSLWYVGLVYDHALWRGNKEVIRQIIMPEMPSGRSDTPLDLGIIAIQMQVRIEMSYLQTSIFGWKFDDCRYDI